MRTLPNDNFKLIGADYNFVPLELWRQYNPSRWRVEKPGRTVVMDGTSSTLYISNLNAYMNATPEADLVDWLRPLLNPESILQNELDSARMKLSDATVSESNEAITLTVRRKTEGTSNSWTKNKSINESDHTCIYKFDSTTKRLQALQVTIQISGRDVPVLELNDIRYNEVLPETLFALQIPEGATRITTPEQMPSVASILGPKDAAEFFLNALAQEDWNGILGVFPIDAVPEPAKKLYGHLSILSIGKPFKSGLYPGYFVPYRIRLLDGTKQSNNLAVRNDNPQKRWVVDGGF